MDILTIGFLVIVGIGYLVYSIIFPEDF
ncbi:MAG: potassium-transporting ATPase subunit F [SAR324 cluster bacterium]|nr:potassium-transporting ATPase subunit F [SAR324 cluster bacterium]